MTSSDKNTEDRAYFDQAMKSLESQVANVGAHVTIDSTTRLAYSREIKAMAKKLECDALAGKISWAQAANQAQETRNLVMEIFRRRSTPVGRAMAQYLKIKDYSLNVKRTGRPTLDAALRRERYLQNSVRIPKRCRLRVDREIRREFKS